MMKHGECWTLVIKSMGNMNVYFHDFFFLNYIIFTNSRLFREIMISRDTITKKKYQRSEM